MSQLYPIGEANIPWQAHHKKQWLEQQQVKRSYTDEVESQIKALSDQLDVEQYGRLDYNPHQYSLYALKSKQWQDHKPTVLVTGGVHGYETSGVHGALAFAKHHAQYYQRFFNVIVLPCISPWGYETINRWNPNAIDPNRSFYQDSPAEESRLAMAYINTLGCDIVCHVDLHETTDTDNSEFRPALAARDGKQNHNWNIPDGFYLVGHTQKPQPAFQKAIIEKVATVTPIAPADESNQLIGVPVEQFGVINYDGTTLGLCMGMTSAPYVTTTEVYPDGASATPQNCIDGQVAAVIGALDYILNLG
ncbi:M14 family metallocarboxypeptidase [Pseudoalteromonas sp. JBTF-M23]|uniref:M14 family metallocarboxypeptidase n=1 Tax=Pseudoalteromonas caenipelagi TaxID=2726988 RepID=A0A849V887_9GAMM|nr:M14 family metallocarboxypeptidase [Pseudoalteromonas caenipelagi]NOU49542.1 M14 family metallocarboxypeptidase [Pseudoalteromonas caenipelagi]